jgi:hypothetical protein
VPLVGCSACSFVSRTSATSRSSSSRIETFIIHQLTIEPSNVVRFSPAFGFGAQAAAAHDRTAAGCKRR